MEAYLKWLKIPHLIELVVIKCHQWQKEYFFYGGHHSFSLGKLLLTYIFYFFPVVPSD